MGFHNTAQQGIVLAEGLNPQPSPQNFRVPLPRVKGGQQGWIRCVHIPIIHLGYPPKVLHKHGFQFLLGFTILPRELMQFFGGVREVGEIRCMMVNVKVVN